MISVDILNQISKTEILISPISKFIFNLTSDDELHIYMEKSVEAMRIKGFNKSVAVAVIELIPYCIEHLAITNFILKHDAIGLRSALPEILNAEEALYYAIGDYFEIRDSRNLQNQFIFLFNIFLEEQYYLINNKVDE